MADLTPIPGWTPVPRLETTTPALAGSGAPMNTQAQALVNRTQQLRDDLDDLLSNTSNLDNTADLDKPVSSATQLALDQKAAKNNPTFTGTVSGIDKTMVGLGNVDNTSDAAKPISTAMASALGGKAPIADATFQGSTTTVNSTNGLYVTGASGNTILYSNAAGASLTLNKIGGAYTSVLYGTRASAGRWGVELGNPTNEGGSNTGSDFAISRYADNGSFLSSPLVITRSSGTVTLNHALSVIGNASIGGTLDVTGATTLSGALNVTGVATFNTTLTTAGNLTVNSNSITVGGTSASSYVYMNDSDEGQRILHCNSNRIGFLSQAGGWGSWCNDDGSWESSNITASGAINAGAVMYVNPGNGYQFNGNAFDGGGGYYCTIAYGSPNYGAFSERFWHQSGSYVGWQVQSSDGKTLRWSGQTGTLNADAFTPWSDRRLKTDLIVLDDARSKIAALTGYEYTMLKSFNYDGTNKRRAGLIAQEVLEVLPVSVELCHAEEGTDGPTEIDPDDETNGQRYSLDYNGVVALLVNDNNAMAARIATLEAQVSALLAR